MLSLLDTAFVGVVAAPGRNIWYNTLGAAYNDESINQSGGAEKRGESTNNGSSTMIGEEVGEVIIPLKHAGADLTGTVYCYVKRLSDDSILETIGTLDASDITNVYENKKFTAGTAHTMAGDETISIECSWSASATEYIFMQTSTSDQYDGQDSGKSYYFTPNWIPSYPTATGSTNDMIASISD